MCFKHILVALSNDGEHVWRHYISEYFFMKRMNAEKMQFENERICGVGNTQGFQ